MNDEHMLDDPGERGCGSRRPGLYLCSGLSPFGMPLEHFLIDPPMPVPEHLDLPNKFQWVDEESQHLMHWVGAESYPYVCDIIEEGRHKGFSFRASPALDLSRLTPKSQMLVAHPRAYNTLWAEQNLPQCDKHIEGHSFPSGVAIDGRTFSMPFPATGPCLFKCWHLIPESVAEEGSRTTALDGSVFYLRRVGSLLYAYRPTGEDASGLVPGFFASLPITHATFVNGEMSQEQRKSWDKARDAVKGTGVAFQTVKLVRGIDGKTHEVLDDEE